MYIILASRTDGGLWHNDQRKEQEAATKGQHSRNGGYSAQHHISANHNAGEFRPTRGIILTERMAFHP